MPPSGCDDDGDYSLVCSITRAATLPVVLSAPHGGCDSDGQARLMKPRTSGIRIADSSTDLLGSALAKELRSMSRDTFTPALVLARFHRRYADANRDGVDEPWGCERGRAAHALYHERLRNATSHARALAAARTARGEACEAAFVIDLHGQALHGGWASVFVGTGNGRHANHDRLWARWKGLLWWLDRRLSALPCVIAPRDGVSWASARFETAREAERAPEGDFGHAFVDTSAEGNSGDESVDAPELSHLATGGGADSAPPPHAPVRKVPRRLQITLEPGIGRREVRYTGGYIVQSQGDPDASHASGGAGGKDDLDGGAVGVPAAVPVDAVQLEFGRALRSSATIRKAMVSCLADAIAATTDPLRAFVERAAGAVGWSRADQSSVLGKLRRVGIFSLDSFTEALADGSLNVRLRRAGKREFRAETRLALLKMYTSDE